MIASLDTLTCGILHDLVWPWFERTIRNQGVGSTGHSVSVALSACYFLDNHLKVAAMPNLALKAEREHVEHHRDENANCR